MSCDRNLWKDTDVVIVSACRTAIGSFGGTLKNTSAVQLGAVVVKEALDRAGLAPEQVDEVLFGNVLQAAQGQNPARQITLNAGLPKETPATTVNLVCGSGLKVVAMASAMIQAGDAEIMVVGGAENMSMAPYAMPAARWGARMNDVKMVDVAVKDGLWDAFNDYHMGITAENVAEEFNVTRQDQDEFAVRSQNRAEAAVKNGRFTDEIVPVVIPQKKGDPIVFDTDEFPKFGTTMEKVSKLRTAFKKENGTVTAANSSGLNDGAAAMILTTKKKAEELGLPVLAKVASYATAGVDPRIMGIGPIPATRKALAKIGKTPADLELVEANEAFASQSVAITRDLGLSSDIVNVNGGAIALGHPIGCSGARILVTLMYEMQKRQAGLGLATLCIGGGMGQSLIVEM